MKNKLSRILGVGVTISLLTSLLAVATPASAADPLVWNSEFGPSTATTSNVILTGSDVSDIAVASDGATIWAVDSLGGKVLKSTNGGGTWSRKTVTGLTTPELVAVSPDDPNIVVVVGDTTEVYLTNDGGTTFSLLTGHLMTGISDVAISPTVAGVRYITLAGMDGSGARIVYLGLGVLVSTWTPIVGTGTTWDTTAGVDTSFTGTANVEAIAFSPNFASDRVLVAVTDNGTSGAKFEIASFSSTKWNGEAGFGNAYPVTVLAGAAPTAADISLAPTYLAADETLRLAYVAVTGGAGALARLDNSTVKWSKTGGFHSVAFDGTTIVAGEAAANGVWYGANPATASGMTATVTNQRPGGATMVKVAWAGANAVAGTSGANSAFAVSKDNGVTFNDVSMVDSAITNITDLALASDAATIYITSNNGVDTSVWRKSGSWERVLSLTGSIVNRLLRLAPESANTAYLVDTTVGQLYYSDDMGEKRWLPRSLSVVPADLAVESAQVVYAVTAGGAVAKSTNGGFTWDTAISSGLTSAVTIISVGANNLVVGSTDGKVAYSTDGNASALTWKTKTVTGIAGSVSVAATGLTSSDYIYAAGDTDADIFAWKVGSTVADDLKDIATVIGAVKGLVLADGVLYAVTDNSSDSSSRLYRSISPTIGLFDSVAVVANFNKAPQALKATKGSNKLWAIDDAAADGLKSFVDDTYNTKVALAGPADAAAPQTNPVTGRAQDIAFTWARPSKSTAYTVDVALDSKFAQKVISGAAVASTGSSVTVVIGPNQLAPFAYPFEPGTTYYWRVRATTPLKTPYSDVRSFTFTPLEPPFAISGPAVGAANVPVKPILTWSEFKGALWYEVTVSEDPSFAIPEFSHNVENLFYAVEEPLKFDTTYYWRVRGVTAEPFVKGSKVITPAGPWMVGAFTTVAEPVAAAPVVTPEPVVKEVIVPGPVQIERVEVPAAPVVVQQPIPSWMLMMVIIIGAILVISLIVLIVRTRKTA